jgi:hypothetical protein
MDLYNRYVVATQRGSEEVVHIPSDTEGRVPLG